MCSIGLFCWFYLRIEVALFRANLCTLPQSRGRASTENIVNLFVLNSDIFNYCLYRTVWTLCWIFFFFVRSLHFVLWGVKLCWTSFRSSSSSIYLDLTGLGCRRLQKAWLQMCFKFSILVFVSYRCTKGSSSWMQDFFIIIFSPTCLKPVFSQVKVFVTSVAILSWPYEKFCLRVDYLIM